IEKSAEFEAQLFTAKAELTVVLDQLIHLKKELTQKEQQTLDNRLQVANPLILRLREDIANSEKTLIEFDSTNPKVQGQRMIVEMKKERLQEETSYLIQSGYLPGEVDPLSINQTIIAQIADLETQKVSLGARVEEYGKLNDYYDSVIESIPATSISYLHLERERQTQERIYLLMKERYEEARIQEASQISSVYVIDEAIPNYLPIKPRTKVNILLGFVLGLALGVGVILLREFLDNSIRSKEDLEKMGLTVMGIIPSMLMDKSKKALDKKFSGEKDYRSRLISHFKPRSPISEAFRSLRTNIELSLADKKIKSLVVTSGGAQEGKSTVISNLSITFAQLGMKVLLIDADMRKPTIYKLFSTPQKPGLANVITKRAKIEDAIFQTEIDNLDVIPAGTLPPNPSELLGSDYMREVFEELCKKYDKVFFDAPPLMAVTDAAILGSITDGVLLVTRAGVAQTEVVSHLRQEMSNSNIRIVGTVLNDVNTKNTSSGYYYYYQRYYFDKYYGEEK
ncbi:MAG: polysaccharide biosynthesis tyrosine autokinase, partial [Candidatus Neomarinimicrobiota bacterium]